MIDDAGGPGEISIRLPNGTIVNQAALVLMSVTVDDDGEYTCIARNDDDMCIPSNAPIMVVVNG